VAGGGRTAQAVIGDLVPLKYPARCTGGPVAAVSTPVVDTGARWPELGL